MTAGYHMDLEKFSLAKYRRILENSRLLPSERILSESLPERIAKLEALGIRNLSGLIQALSDKRKLEDAARKTGIPVPYLTVLRRRAGIYAPKPVALNTFPGFAAGTIKHLAAAGIRNSKQLLEHAATRGMRDALSRKTGIAAEDLLELAKLSDLSRAPYVGGVWARLFYEAGADTMAKLAGSRPADLCARLRETNERLRLTKSGIPSVEDMAAGLEVYKMIPVMLEI